MSYLRNPEIINWLHVNPFINLPNHSFRKLAEDSWGRSIIGKDTCQWTTPLSEKVFKEYLQISEQNLLTHNKFCNFITDKAVYKLKCRSWNTSGTVGEKILGLPYKYSELPRLSGKPLYIVLMAYQEKDSFNLFDTTNPEKNEMISNWRRNGVEFVKFTELYKVLSIRLSNSRKFNSERVLTEN
jgi:hypothetical protein